MEPKELGNQPAAPFSAYAEAVTVKPQQHAGLTKREHFAGLAMQGLIANPQTAAEDERQIADWAIYHADALLAALAKAGA